MSNISDAVSRITSTYQAAVLAKNADALMKLYDPKVQVFDAWGVWSHDGADAWRRTVEAWFGSLGPERVEVSFDDARELGGPAFTVFSAIVCYASVSAQGAAPKAMHNRLTWVLKTSGHVLRIVHEHTSAPIGFDDSKAILQHTP